ncbi:MAG: acetylornithine/succinylornithine family transaminase [Absicoccus sp.]|uniref:Acetylornithine/succinylornithine family transaminase n=1 Tax=Absicoccus intestinalis TaxID=2926319 RepID=A0ABU4WKD0_9FIRM|nr:MULTISPECIES: acetylornithine/succinylornithine family transaminase [unclassified Absicoccus]MDX8417020.1 acetylornithine/succinylornithine family transaminase [Absicoccus sp. CLA-KB-P134]MDY3036183.1 acetylornithine/succinylornithine family transaminase [Absicoccus sp.]
MKLKDTGLTFEDIKAKVNKYMIETYERFDFLAETAKDQYMYDENGTPYLDFYAGIAVNSAGNCNEKVVAAIQDQCKDIMQTFNYPYTIPQALLAEKVCETIGMDKIFFQNSGTEANEAMIKMARKYGIEHYGPNRYHIVTAKNGFHGRTFGAMSATGQPGNGCQVGFGPMTYGFSYAPYNDLDAFKDACNENTIAIMVEPVQGEGGVHPATKEFLTGLREFCDEKGMLLLIDEVQTGWCRTGAVMSYMNYGVKPDIVSMAKALGGGMPIGAICATEEVSTAFDMGSHGTTFGGHPVCCAAALAEVNELLDRDLAGNAKKMGDYICAKLEKLPHVVEVRHQGLLIGVEFDETINSTDLKHECLHRHLLTTAIGQHILRLIPPLIIDEKDCDKAVEIIKESVIALGKGAAD